jgi:LmbE family N-acetylglucosaminyl deacetylase
MVVFAHPDDAEWGSSATVAKWIREGAAVEYVCVTDGSAGWNGPDMTRERLTGIRREEQLAACAVLGVQRCDFLGVVDGHVEVTADLRRDITRHVRRFRPDVLVVPDPSRLWDQERGYINHTDHRAVGMACLAVINPDAPSRPMFPELLDEGLEPFEVPNLWLATADADAFVDISATIDTKIEALKAHVSQGTAEAEPRIRERAEAVAALSEKGYRYAEGFKALRFVDDEEREPAR